MTILHIQPGDYFAHLNRAYMRLAGPKPQAVIVGSLIEDQDPDTGETIEFSPLADDLLPMGGQLTLTRK